MRWLAPWILAEPQHRLPDHAEQRFAPPNCEDTRFNEVFTGSLRKQPRTIVDFVPFGYDLDMLEIRLLESWHAVDLFVVYEQTVTHQGLSKVLYFNSSLASGRWDKFMPKILHVIGTPSRISEAVQATPYLQLLRAKCARCLQDRAMHFFPVHMMKTSTHPLVAVLRNTPDALALQNDEDEMVSGHVLHHLRHCEAKAMPPFYAPASSYRNSLDWMMVRSKGADVAQRFVQQRLVPNGTMIGMFLSTLGPTIYSLSTALKMNGTPRMPTSRGGSDLYHGMPHLGPGAAIHLSAVAEPLRAWLRRGSAIVDLGQQGWTTAVPWDVLVATLHRNATPEFLRQSMKPQCSRPGTGLRGMSVSGSMVHVSTLDDATRAMLDETFPFAVRTFPERYPFQLPAPEHADRCCWSQEALVCCWVGLGTAPDHACSAAKATRYPARLPPQASRAQGAP